MSELIPLLSDLCEAGNQFRVDPSFTRGFLKMHDMDWRRAQDHWELVVKEVLDTEEVPTHASGLTAMALAVLAASMVLTRTLTGGRCPICARLARGRRQRQGDAT